MKSVSKITLIIFSFIFLTNYALADEKTDIYSKLRDRQCAEMSLDKCDCPAAKEMKAYIDALLEMGATKTDIFYKVAKKFSPKLILDEQIKTEIEQRLIKEAGDKRPQIIPEPPSLDFGKVSKKQAKASKIFKLHNKGNSDLIITNLRASCGCTSVSLKSGKTSSPYFSVAGAGVGWQVAIESGKYGELEVVLDLNHASMTVGKQIREVFVSNNDPLNREADLKVEIEVTE